MNIKDRLPPISKSGFLLGAALALAAAAIKVVVLDGIEAHTTARKAERETTAHDDGRPVATGI